MVLFQSTSTKCATTGLRVDDRESVAFTHHRPRSWVRGECGVRCDIDRDHGSVATGERGVRYDIERGGHRTGTVVVSKLEEDNFAPFMLIHT